MVSNQRLSRRKLCHVQSHLNPLSFLFEPQKVISTSSAGLNVPGCCRAVCESTPQIFHLIEAQKKKDALRIKNVLLVTEMTKHKIFMLNVAYDVFSANKFTDICCHKIR